MRGRTRKVRGSKPFAAGLAAAHERARKSLRSRRSPFAEADPKIQPKNLRGSSRGRRKQKRLQALLAEGSRKGFAEGVVSVMKLYKNKNHRSIVIPLFVTLGVAGRRIVQGTQQCNKGFLQQK